MKLGIIREGKSPPDSRVPLNPEQCRAICNDHQNIEIIVQPSANRCFSDAEYEEQGIIIQENLADCDILMGVKEVPIEQLIGNKTYFFFSHTIKKQPYNRNLILAILSKKIRLLDYEVLTNDLGQRLIAFGHFAGMVGAHNALWTYGQRTGLFGMKRMKDCFDYEEAKNIYKQLTLPHVKIVLTGGGRVANGAAAVLEDMRIQKVSSTNFLTSSYSEPVFTQIDCQHYVTRKDKTTFELSHFFKHPAEYESNFVPYTRISDIMINGIYWDNAAPAFFTEGDMRQDDFQIQVIADVTCDIAPVSSIPSTLKATTIADPVFGFDPTSGKEVAPYQKTAIDMMTIDNLPNEMPRDASTSFGQQFIDNVLEELMDKDDSLVIKRATVTEDGKLGDYFEYLEGYVKG